MSFGLDRCGGPGNPTVFTNVIDHLTWIINIITTPSSKPSSSWILGVNPNPSSSWILLPKHSNLPVVSSSTPSVTIRPTCGDDQFQCLDDGHCISMDWKCDGHPHCRDGSDEVSEECPGWAIIIITISILSLCPMVRPSTPAVVKNVLHLIGHKYAFVFSDAK